MADYKYTKEEFVKLIDNDGFTTWETNPIDVENLVELGIEGLNEIACDTIVEDGYLLEDITYSAKNVVDGKIIIEATGHAGAWKLEHCCPMCGELKKMVFIPDAVGNGSHGSTECSQLCGWTEED